MALDRTQIVEAAFARLRDHGLAAMSMRRVAQDLGVQPGALYHHVSSKQDLLASVAQRILPGDTTKTTISDPARAATDIRRALLPVRDSADVVSFVQAFRPETLVPLQRLSVHFEERMPRRQAHWAAQTLTHYVLGFVAEEQNRLELARAKIRSPGPSEAEANQAFRFGVRAILRGLTEVEPEHTSDKRRRSEQRSPA